MNVNYTASTEEFNRVYTIKKLFTEAYYNYRFSSLFISTLDKMTRMTIPSITRFEYNDINKYIEISYDSSTVSIRDAQENPLYTRVTDVLIGFLRFCYDDNVMRDILYSINSDDFKVFDTYMKSIDEYFAVNSTDCVTKYAVQSQLQKLAYNLFTVVRLPDQEYLDTVRINLI